MIDQVRRTIERCGMLRRGDRVAVALSGGADSVCLLHLLCSLKEEYDLTLSAVHLNHGIRGAEAARDERFCRALCETFHIPLTVRFADIPARAAERKISEELCGREERYRLFAELSASNDRVATAHTASDNVETVLFHLTRGASLSGAAGIPPKRGYLIRPLIDCTRAEVEAYCSARGLDYVTDSTNLTDLYTRNRIRHTAVPVLKELNPRLEEAVRRFSESAAAAEDYLCQQARALLTQAQTDGGYRTETLLQAHTAVCSRALMLLCAEQADFHAETRHLELLLAVLKSGGAVDLGAYTAICRQGSLRVSPKAVPKPPAELPLTGSVAFDYNGVRYTASVDTGLAETPVFRARRAGDRFTYSKRGVTKPLRKALNEHHIPAEQRDRLVLLCQDSTVLWCASLGYSRQGEALRQSAGLTVTQEQSPLENLQAKGQHHA